MPNLQIFNEMRALPGAADEAAVERGLERWRRCAQAGEDRALAAFVRALPTLREGRALLAALFGNSPFLTHCLLSDPGFFQRLAEEGLDRGFEEAAAYLGRNGGAEVERGELMARLRIARRRVALAVGLADVADAWPLQRITSALTQFAEAVLGLALDHLFLAAARQGEIELGTGTPSEGSGFVVLGMGKLGAHELNFSSDIDLIVLYDEERMAYRGQQGPQQGFVRLTRELVRMLEERTREGYVFRTDLRLRPDPGATPVALSMGAAELYYESVGQNWERAAMIKARPVAGDRDAGAAFLERLVPFVWRRNLDFAAIADIHSIKRQIHAHRGHGAIAVHGHNIKLGRGGIREVELFAQTQQLIFGGREPALRLAATCPALAALSQAQRIDPGAADELTGAYHFLRRVEHRLQMVADEQTHTLPRGAAALDAFARFMGYEGADPFAEALIGHLADVERHYASLFEEQPSLSEPGNLVFTGEEDDPDTLATLAGMGFAEGPAVAAVIRGWHRGRTRATRTKRARELLTELVPTLLEALAKTVNPDAAFMRFNEFLARLPAGVQLFSLLYANPGLLSLLAEILGSAPRLAAHLSHNAALLDSVLDTDFYEPLPPLSALRAELTAALARAHDYQDVLDAARRWQHDREFQVGIQILRNIMPGEKAARELSDIADAVLLALEPVVEAEFVRVHGRIPGGGLAVLALGKLGGREMTTESDLDLVFVYEAPDLLAPSDGAKPLAAAPYFTRLSQRLINALKAPTAAGVLYEIDMRLRPSGRAGPLASEIDAFESYQRESAWTWEHLALTRARVITGPAPLRERLARAVREVLTRPRDPEALRAEVAAMRVKISAELGTDNPWRLKQVRGGLLDIDFIAEYLELRHAAERPEILKGNSAASLVALAEAGLMDAAVADELVTALQLMRRLQALLRLTVGTQREESQFPDGLRASLAEAAGAVNFEALKAELLAAQERVLRHFAAIIGEA